MPGSVNTKGKGKTGVTKNITLSSNHWNINQDSTQKQNSLISMKSGSNKSEAVSESIGSTEPSSSIPLEPIETAKEVKEKDHPKRGGSWIKNLGTGMRTLRLKKGDKKDKSASTIFDPEAESKPSTPTPPRTSSLQNNEASSSIPPLSPNQDPKLRQKQSLPPLPAEPSTSSQPSPSKSHVSKGKKGRSGGSMNGTVPRDKTKSNTTSPGSGDPTLDKADPARFIGDGLAFKAKLIGILEVSGPRGDRICQEALSELKMAVKAAGEHKQKVTVHVALDGLRIRDEKTGDCLYHHQVHKISFIAQDLTDTRAFGYIFGSPDTGHRFFGIKTEKSASQVVMAMRDLFQVVFDLKKKEIERAKQQLEMQQKFLATRAAETAPRTFHKSGIAETYIEGACALGGPPSPRTASAPAEADLLNLEVELTSLQQGLDNIHSTLIDTAHAHAPFNRGSTTSISSDPLNPMPPAFKYSAAGSSSMMNNSSFSSNHTATHQNANFSSGSSIRANTSTPVVVDPFGDSFDPFDSSGRNGNGITSPCFTGDPFSNVDPFPTSKFDSSGEFLTADPFETSVGGSSFGFPESNSFAKHNSSSSSAGGLNRQASISSESSDKVMGRGSASSRDLGHSLSGLTAAGTSNVLDNRADAGGSANVSRPIASSWQASFEDNFVPESTVMSNGPTSSSSNYATAQPQGVNLDIFTDLDPLGIGRVRPFVDRKDFFNDLKNPPRKVMSELSGPTIASSILEQVSVPPPMASTKEKLQVEGDAALPNSFSTNFNPASGPVPDFDSHFKTLHSVNAKNDMHLRTSSIRVQPSSTAQGGDSPPSYSPPPPPPGGGGLFTSAVSNNVYFVNSILPSNSATSPSNRDRVSSKRSPQLLRNMTISSTHVGASGQDSSPKTLPRSFLRSGRTHTLDSCGDDIPNLTPPPRPPHSGGSSTLTRNSALSSAVPRPHSGSGDGRRQQSLQSSFSSSGQQQPPEPPPRPLATTILSSNGSSSVPLVSPPPLPPKKQNIPGFPSPAQLTKVLYTREPVSRNLSSADGSANDLPLPVPVRKNIGREPSSTRYAFPPEQSCPVLSRPSDPSSMSTSNLSQYHPELSLEIALNQVASLSLGQLATKLQLPVDKLSSCTIQELAMKLTLMDLENQKKEVEAKLASRRLEVNASKNQAEEDSDFSTVSAPAAVSHSRPSHSPHRQSNFDRYAVFRELTVEDASGFSIMSPPAQEGSEDEECLEPGSKTLTSRESSSEKTLQADFDGPGHGLSTMDDVTDVNFSGDEDEKSALFDEVVDLNSKAEWATFESNFDDQFIPLATTFNMKSEDSPWDSDSGENGQAIGPTESVINECKTYLKSPKAEQAESSQLEFQPLEKPSLEPPPRRQSRDTDVRDRDRQPDSLELKFQRQSSGSSRHSDRSGAGLKATINNTTSDFSDSGRDRDRPPPRRQSSRDWEDRRPRTDSRNSYSSATGRRYSRDGDSDEFGRPSSGSRRRRDPYYDEEDDDRSYASTRSNCSSRKTHHVPSHRRHGPSKHYSQSHHRDGRTRRVDSPDKYSNHESDCDDSFGEEGSRRRRAYHSREKEYRPSSRPPSSGSGTSKRHSHYRDDYYREPRRDRDRDHHHYHRDRDRHRRDEDVREASDLSGEEGSRHRRSRGRRPPREKPSSAYQYNTNSPSWDSESPPPDDRQEPLKRGDVYRRSDRDQDYRSPRESSKKGSRYQSEQSLSSKPKLSASEFKFEDEFSSGQGHAQPRQRPEPTTDNQSNNGSGRSSCKLTLENSLEGEMRKLSFEDSFVPIPSDPTPSNGTSHYDEPEDETNNVFFSSKFDFESQPTDLLESSNTGTKNSSGSAKELGSVIEEKSEPTSPEEDGSPEINRKNELDQHQQDPILRKSVLNDTISEIPDPDMKKSDSFNIFERAKDPFADDDFFV